MVRDLSGTDLTLPYTIDLRAERVGEGKNGGAKGDLVAAENDGDVLADCRGSNTRNVVVPKIQINMGAHKISH